MLSAILIVARLLALDPLAVATARAEADGDPTATECPREPRARTARRHHDDPRFATAARPCYCGLYQVTASSPAECAAARLELGALVWAAQLGAWRDACARAGAEDLETCAIAGYAVGGAGVLAATGRGGGAQGAHGLAYARALRWRARSAS